MARTASGITLLRYTETHEHKGIRLVNSFAWNSTVPSAVGAIASNGPATITHSYIAILTSGSETYDDGIVQKDPFSSSGGTASLQAACHHLPIPGVVDITEVWTVNGTDYTYTSSDSGSYGLNTFLRNNQYALVVFSEWHGKHEITNVMFAGATAIFQDIAFHYHEDVAYSPSLTGRVSIDLAASGDAMFVDCREVANTGGSAGPRYSGRMRQTISAPMSWSLKFKPTDEEGKIVNIPVSVLFGPGDLYQISRTTPVDETISFPANAGLTGIELVRDQFGTNPFAPSPINNSVDWDPYVASQNIAGARSWPPYYGNGMTMLQYVLPSDYIGPLYDATSAGSTTPPRICMYPYHRWIDAAATNYQTLTTLTLAASRSYTRGTWSQVGSAAGASVAGIVLTAAVTPATFSASITSSTNFRPYRWIKLTLNAASDGMAIVEFSLPSSSNYAYPIGLKAGTHDYFFDLTTPPNFYVKYVPKAPPAAVNGLRLRFANNVVSVTGCAAVVKNRAQLFVLGNGGDTREFSPPALYGHVDGASTVRAVTTGGPGSVSVNVKQAILNLVAQTGITAGTINDTPAAWVGPLEHGGYISAFNLAGVRLGAYDLVAGAALKSTCYSVKIWAYANAGGNATQMFGGGSFPAVADFIFGGVATATMVPRVGSNTLVAEWPASIPPTTPGTWRYTFLPESDGWARKANPEKPSATDGELYALDMVERQIADGQSPTVAALIIKANRWFGSLLAEGFPKEAVFPWLLQDDRGRIHQSWTYADVGSVKYRRSDFTIRSGTWEVESTPDDSGAAISAAFDIDLRTRRIEMLIGRKTDDVFSAHETYSDDGGASWTPPVEFMANALVPIPRTGVDGSRVRTWFEFGSGTSGPGSARGITRLPGDQDWSAPFTFLGSDGASIVVAENGMSPVDMARDGQRRWSWSPIIDGETEPSDWYSLDFCRTWTRIT